MLWRVHNLYLHPKLPGVAGRGPRTASARAPSVFGGRRPTIACLKKLPTVSALRRGPVEGVIGAFDERVSQSTHRQCDHNANARAVLDWAFTQTEWCARNFVYPLRNQRSFLTP
jgi:hypothetical protein